MMQLLIDAFMPVFIAAAFMALIFGIAVYAGRKD